MRQISQRVKKVIDNNPEYRHCMLRAHPDHVCGGRRNTREHALIIAGHQVDEPWAIISCCAAGQEVDFFQDAGTMDKNLNRWVALNRANDADFDKYPKAKPFLLKQREYLNGIYGVYMPVPVVEEGVINYPF